jgi:uncharacterized protein YggE
MTVKGVGRIELKPDFAQVRATVSTPAPALDEAAKAHRDRATRALSALHELRGIEIEDSTFSLNRERPVRYAQELRNPEPKPATPPFMARTTFSLKTKAIDDLNAAITKLSASGLFEVASVHFGVEQERAALNQARRQAMVDARDQAAAYADAGDLRLVEIVSVTDGEAAPLVQDGYADMPVPRFVQIIPPSTVAFSSSVQVTWRIAPR